MNRYQFVSNNESSKNTNIKYEINKLSTNKRCNFLEIIVPINKTSEQKLNGYCNVNFVFMYASLYVASWYSLIQVSLIYVYF
jgi:hypothetical protein